MYVLANVFIYFQLGILGICQNNYFIEEDQISKELYVTQIVDVNNCQERAAVSSGMALALKNKNCLQVCLHFCPYIFYNSEMLQVYNACQFWLSSPSLGHREVKT